MDIKNITKINMTEGDTLFVQVPDDTSSRHIMQMGRTLGETLRHNKVCVYNRDLGFKVVSQVEIKDEWGRGPNPL